MHISKLPQGEVLHQFNSLSEEAKERARQQVLFATIHTQKEEKRKFRSIIIQENLNELINKYYLYQRLVTNYKLVKKLKANQADLDKYITQNLCYFTANGEYVTYSLI
jgi:hypothetical protein